MSARLFLFPNRAHDEQLLRIMEGLARRGRIIVDAEEGPTSPYLRRPLRTEAEARAAQQEGQADAFV